MSRKISDRGYRVKKVIVACGGAIATSTIVSYKIKELADKYKINIEICQCRISEISSYVEGADLVVPTTKIKKEYGVPVISGVPFISKVKLEETEKEILDILMS